MRNLVRDAERRAKQAADDHSRRQDILAAKRGGSFCPPNPATCRGWVLVEGTETLCPYEGTETLKRELWDPQRNPDGLCPHWYARETRWRVLRLIAEGLPQDAATAEWSGLPENLEVAMRRYCATLKERVQAGDGMIITGGVGGGKTSALALVAAQALKTLSDGAWMFCEAVDLLEWLADRDERANQAVETPLLLLDDLGTEYAHERTAAKFGKLVNARWGNKRSTVVTTNLGREDLSQGGRLARMLDRLQHRAPWLVVQRESQRRPARVQDWGQLQPPDSDVSSNG